MIDYYRVGDDLLAEEFILAEDCTTVGLRGARWSTVDGQWRPATDLSRSLRTDPARRGTARAVHPDASLPAPAFADEYLPLPVSPPLRLRPHDGTDRRVYRLLFANDLSAGSIEALRSHWRSSPPTGDPHVFASADRRVGADVFSWNLRRIGGRIAWCVDLTVVGTGSATGAVGPVLRELGTDLRRHGMLPVTVERFS
jgi:hypothetical protein